MLLPLVALASEPKFHYYQHVVVVSGFYKNCKGFVTYYYGSGLNRYTVQVKDCHANDFIEDFKEDELKEI